MTNLIDQFINDMLSIEHLSRSIRPLEIRRRMTEELEDVVRHNGGGIEDVRSVLQDAKDKAFQAISNHSPKGFPTQTAELYQEVFEELNLRAHTLIRKSEVGTFEVAVSRHGETRVARSNFQSQEEATKWRDSDTGASVIKATLSQIP